MEFEPKDLVKIKIAQLIKFADSFAGIEVYISIGSKLVKLNYSTDQFIDILRKLQQKEMEEVLILPDDCKKIIGHIQESLSAKNFYDPSTIPEVKVESIEASMQVVKNIINQIGISAENVKLLKVINTRAMSILAESPSIFAFIKRFKKNCSEEFLKTILTSYIMSLVIDKFPWTSDSVKEKGALASLLCDLSLDKEDFQLMKRWEKNGEPLPEKLLRHPVDIAESLRLKRNLIPYETITIIEQHHEKPDGSGFPLGIEATRFNQLSSIFIICQRFAEDIFEEKFDFEKRLDIVVKLQKTYSGKPFDKALDALISVVDA